LRAQLPQFAQNGSRSHEGKEASLGPREHPERDDAGK
jgi:hypothetical protein